MIHVSNVFLNAVFAASWPMLEAQPNSDFSPLQSISNQVVLAIQGSKTNREPMSTPRILPLEVEKRFVPLVDVMRLLVSGARRL